MRSPLAPGRRVAARSTIRRAPAAWYPGPATDRHGTPDARPARPGLRLTGRVVEQWPWADEAEPGYWEWPPSTGELIRTCWRVVVAQDGSWTTGGAEYWGLCFTRYADGRQEATLAGPAVEARQMSLQAGEVSWGVDLHAHVTGRRPAKGDLVGKLQALPTEHVGGQWWYELAGVRLAVPDVGQLEAAVAQLHAAGLLFSEPVTAAALAGRETGVPDRTLRRRFRAVTALRQAQVTQIERARAAFELLRAGVPLADAAGRAGYADQSHMTRELRRLTGRTPGRLVDADDLSLG